MATVKETKKSQELFNFYCTHTQTQRTHACMSEQPGVGWREVLAHCYWECKLALCKIV